jgi:hypothetical protein
MDCFVGDASSQGRREKLGDHIVIAESAGKISGGSGR